MKGRKGKVGMWEQDSNAEAFASLACPHHARYPRRGAAAPPPDLRKGFAFPKDTLAEQLPARRLEG